MKKTYNVAFTSKGSITQSFVVTCLPEQIKKMVKDHRKDNPEVKGHKAVITTK